MKARARKARGKTVDKLHGKSGSVDSLVKESSRVTAANKKIVETLNPAARYGEESGEQEKSPATQNPIAAAFRGGS